MTSSKLKRFLVTTTVAISILSLTLAAYAGAGTRCQLKDGKCKVVAALEERTEGPFVVCQAGDINVDITLRVECRDGSTAGPKTFTRCGNRTEPIVWTDPNGITHKLQPRRGATWGTILNGDCKRLAYKNDS